MIKLLLIMLNEDISKVDNENLIEFLVNTVYKKYDVDNISKAILIFRIFILRSYIKKHQFR